MTYLLQLAQFVVPGTIDVSRDFWMLVLQSELLTPNSTYWRLDYQQGVFTCQEESSDATTTNGINPRNLNGFFGLYDMGSIDQKNQNRIYEELRKIPVTGMCCSQRWAILGLRHLVEKDLLKTDGEFSHTWTWLNALDDLHNRPGTTHKEASDALWATWDLNVIKTSK